MLYHAVPSASSSFFFFNDTATTEIYTLSLHDALPIFVGRHAHRHAHPRSGCRARVARSRYPARSRRAERSEEHTSELQSPCNLVCRLLLEKKKRQSVSDFQRVIPMYSPPPRARYQNAT